MSCSDAVADRFPDRVAIEVPPAPYRPERIAVTYQVLRHRANAIAATLRPLVQRDAIVAILLSRDSPDLYAAQLGVLKAGAAFLCLDDNFPDEHLRAVLRDADPVALIADRPGNERLASLGVTLPSIVDPATATGELDVAAAVDPADLAYVIYTSGTTGAPKGVMIEHRAIANLVNANVDYFGLTCDARVAQCSTSADLRLLARRDVARVSRRGDAPPA